MFAKLFLLFTLVPLLELFVLIPLASEIGVLWTLVIVAATALVGAFLGRQQGLRAWNAVTTELSAGQIPGDSIIDGLLVFAGCILLVTPGVLTDAVGIALLVPFTRAPVRMLVKKRFAKRIEDQTWTMVTDTASHQAAYYSSAGFGGSTQDVIDITPVQETK